MSTQQKINLCLRLMLILSVSILAFSITFLCKASDQTNQENLKQKMIVGDGKPMATILLGEGYGDHEKLAAIELQHYIEKSTGVRLSVVIEPEQTIGYVIHIGVSKPSEGEDSETFSIKTGPRSTDIIGNSSLGALYGVYDFLEEVVGVRWYLPGPLGEVVPKHKTLILPPLNYQESPSFPMRWVGEDRWMLRNKQNRCKDGFNIYPGIYHTQNDLLPKDKYFEEHPEYFALLDGERSNRLEAKLCYSNPEVAREVARNMVAILDTNLSVDLLSFSPTDGQLWCECDSCKAMDEEDVAKDRSKSRRSLIFYNSIASELKKTHPEAKILVGAYNVYNWPPRDTTIKADPMLNVIITHYEDYCMAHPLPNPTCPPNKRYVKLLKSWEDLVEDNIYFYEYYYKVNWFDLPWPIVHSIKKDMPWYKKQGYQGLYTQYTTQNRWTLFPNYYVAARLLWNVELNVDSLVNKMYEDLFREAAPWMKKYYALMEKWMEETDRHFPGHGVEFGPVIFTLEVKSKLREYYENAVRENQDPIVSMRLERIGTSLEYVERLMHYAELKKRTKEESGSKEAYALANKALGIGKQLVDEIRRDRIKWGGIVSKSVVKEGVPEPRRLRLGAFLAKDVNRWEIMVANMKP